MKAFYLLFLGVLLYNCTAKSEDKKEIGTALFTKISSEKSGVVFENKVQEDLYFNFLNYSYIYNGGGIAVGDINNDGLDDLYFTSNQQSNKLYINKGDFQFEDITEKAGVQDIGGWSTGVSMIDINQDGWLDIYVCKSGSLQNPELRKNKLFINQKNNSFREAAADYGLDDPGFSTQAYFFDCDLDGDLDMYLVNHRSDFNNNVFINPTIQNQLVPEMSDQLFRNESGRYINITHQSGVANKAWGLSASIGDFNNDRLPDIYVANDFLEPDFLYINQGDGTFKDEIRTYFNHIAINSMGSDYADINNDLFPDLVVLDMLAEDHKRSKENMATMSTENFHKMVAAGYHHQYMANMLQLNNGNNTFSEIGQLAGIAKTDWSWAPLLADFDNDGWNDLFVSNGIEHDLSNQDFRTQMRNKIRKREKVTLEEAIGMMPSTKLKNYLFINNRQLGFSKTKKNSGLEEEVNSNGAAYADLDNDGDLDLILNNQSAKAGIYKNNSRNNYLKLRLKGPEKNMEGIGATVQLFTDSTSQTKQQFVSRGYQSSVSHTLIFGVGNSLKVDSLKITWATGESQILKNVSPNQTLELAFQDAYKPSVTRKTKSVFEIIEPGSLGIDYRHTASKFNDYSRQLLLPQKQSTTDAAIAVADVNLDGLDDLFIGNSLKAPAALYIQLPDGTFKKSNLSLLQNDAVYKDQSALFFDADGDKDPDLYVASGGYELPENDGLMQDRLYINDGRGNFKRSDAVSGILTSSKALAAADFDSDGDLDLFVGGGVVPGKYPQAYPSYLLENRQGVFQKSLAVSPSDFQNNGLIKDAVFSDYDQDGDPDLIVVGEWTSVLFFENKNGSFVQRHFSGLDKVKGWFQTIKEVDLNLDGKTDYLIGNWGWNNKFHPTREKPLHIFADYFDNNTSFDIALSKTTDTGLLPVRGKECSSQQTPYLNYKIKTYTQFADASMAEIYGEEKLKNALHLTATDFSSLALINSGNGNFTIQSLPVQAQFSPTLDFLITDLDQDNSPEIIGVGNVYDAEVETIRYDASKGYVLEWDKERGIQPVKNTGVFNNANAKAIRQIRIKGALYLIILNHNDRPSLLKIKTP